MKNIGKLFLALLVVAAVSALCFPAWAAPKGSAAQKSQGSGATVLVLPFQVNTADAQGAASKNTLEKDLPALFAASLAERGFKVIPLKDSLKADGEMSVERARTLAKAQKAAYAVYGSLSQAGKMLSLDVRLVPTATSGGARPYYAERGNVLELKGAVDDITSRMAGGTAAVVTAKGLALPKGAIAGVQVRGLKVLDPDVVLMRVTVGKGDAVDPSVINTETKRVWDIGYFSDVTAEIENTAEGPMLVFSVKEKPRISDLIINGSDAVRKDDIRAAMTSKTGSVVNERLLAQDIQKVVDLYRKEGYYLAEVQYRLEEREGTASAALVFDVVEGKKLYIKKVGFTGLEKIDEGELKKQLALSERSLISFFTGTGVLRDEYLERDAAAIQAYFLNHGYVEARAGVPEVVYEDDGIVVTFPVQEGEQHSVGEIAFKGDLIDTTDRLNEIILLDNHRDSNKYFALDVMQDDIKRLTELYGNYGYAFAEVDTETEQNPTDKTINITYVLNKKHKVYVRRVNTEGNVRTRDNVILREMRLADGDVFNAARMRRSTERLHRLRYFDEVETNIVPTENPDEVDLLTTVKEGNTGAVMAGVGYSTYYKIGVSGTIEERNLFGKGYSLSLNGFTSSRNTQLDMSFVNPRLYDSNLGFGNDTYIVREEWDDFEKKTIGNTMRLFYPLGEYTTLGVGYRLDRYTLENVPEDAPRSYKEYEGRNLSSVASARITYDSTDSRERPSKGYVVRLGGEYGGGGLGGNDNFFKPMIEAQGFHSLYRSPDHVFHWRTRAGAVFENSNKPVPVFDRFFIGGIDSIRGYSYEDLSPYDPTYGDELGGDRMAFLNLEYIWTFHKEMGLAVVPFFDIGFQTDSKQISDPFGDLKKSVGMELRWRSPMGDLRFAYGYPLDKSTRGDKLSGRFEFSMGQTF